MITRCRCDIDTLYVVHNSACARLLRYVDAFAPPARMPRAELRYAIRVAERVT